MKKRLLPFLIALCLFLTGCFSGSHDLANIGVTKGIAIDVGETPDTFRMTVCMLKPDGQGTYTNISAEGTTVSEIKSQISLVSERYPYTGQNDVILISRELAEKGLDVVIQSFFFSNERHGAEQVVIMNGEAASALEYKEGFSPVPPVSIIKLLENANSNSGIAKANLKNVENGLKGIGHTTLIPIATMEEERLLLQGMAVIQDGKMVGELSESQAMGAKWIASKLEGGSMTISALGERVGIQILDHDSRITGRQVGDTLHFDIDISLNFAVAEQSGTQDMTLPENEEELRAATEEAVRFEALSAIDAAQAMHADFLNLAPIYLNHNDEARAAYGENWENLLPQFTFDVQVEGILKYYGVLQKVANPGD